MKRLPNTRLNANTRGKGEAFHSGIGYASYLVADGKFALPVPNDGGVANCSLDGGMV